MGTPAKRHQITEFVVAPELADVAKRLGLPMSSGDRVRFEVIDGDGGDAAIESWPPTWIGSIETEDTHLAANARSVMRSEFKNSDN